MTTKQKTLRASLAALALAAGATEAHALFDVQAMVGRRWYEFEQGDDKGGVQGQEIYIGAHLDPIPLVPVAFGASVAMITLSKDDLGSDVKEAQVLEPAIDVMAWIPMVPIVTPYAKVKIPLMAKYRLSSESAGVKSEAVASVSGYHLNVGIKYSPIPLVRVLLETGLGMQKAAYDEYKSGGVTLPKPEDLDMNSKVVLLGVEVGI